MVWTCLIYRITWRQVEGDLDLVLWQSKFDDEIGPILCARNFAGTLDRSAMGTTSPNQAASTREVFVIGRHLVSTHDHGVAFCNDTDVHAAGAKTNCQIPTFGEMARGKVGEF
jgi:hypothetical protein